MNQGAMIAIMITGLITASPMLFEHWWTGPLGALVAAVVVFAVAGGAGTQGYRFIVTGFALTTIGGAITQAALSWRGLSAATAIPSWRGGSTVTVSAHGGEPAGSPPRCGSGSFTATPGRHPVPGKMGRHVHGANRGIARPGMGRRGPGG
ncbi:iron chelate uptake ABC transporter family permease subunit [Nonomuraea sp. NPDC046570]|uniref:iron chelate uptake ABC transporter family permease subunit n=1 Tax=Nonomuraea sp. NPDC046570 TaxID=3155255 RepID=UPI0033C2A9BB